MPDMSLQWEEVFLFFYYLQHSAEVRNIRKAQKTHQKECKMNRRVEGMLKSKPSGSGL